MDYAHQDSSDESTPLFYTQHAEGELFYNDNAHLNGNNTKNDAADNNLEKGNRPDSKNNMLVQKDEANHKIKSDTGNQAYAETFSPEDKETIQKIKLLSMPRRSLCILFLCTAANLLSGMSISLLAPFFTTVARKKGMSSFLVGLMFSVYELVIFVFSPIIGNYLTVIGPKFTHISSVFVGSVTTAIFGTLHMCPSGVSFIILSFVSRSLQAVGYCGYMAASFAIVSSEFPERVATVFGILEAGNTMGYMLGPLFGGILYDVGGFGVPFYVMGGLVFFNGVLLYVFLPTPKQEDTKKKRKTSAFILLKSPMFVVSSISVLVGAMGIKYIEPTLANHIEPFGLSSTMIGLIFLIEPLLSCTSGPFWGYLSDCKGIQGPIIVVGHFILAIAFFMAGPSIPFLQLEIWTVATSQVLVGAAYECTIIPTMKCMVMGALEMGMEDSIHTYGLVCGVFNSIYYLGGAIGPLMGGLLAYNLGTSVLGFLNAVVVVICLVFFLWWKKNTFEKSIEQ